MAVLVALPIVASLPVWPNWMEQAFPATHETFRYAVIGNWFLDAIGNGIAYPRWLPHMNGGYGYPTFVYYQPGYFFLNALAALLTDSPLFRQMLTLSFIAILGGAGTYLLARRFVAPFAGLLLVAAFQLAPYAYLNLYQRGDLSEWLTLQTVSWPIYFQHRYFESASQANFPARCGSWLGLAITTGLVLYSHPVALMFLPLILLSFALAQMAGSNLGHARKRIAFELAGALFAALALSAPYWLSVAVMKPFVNVQAALTGGFEAWNNAASLRSMLFGPPAGSASFNEAEFLGMPFVCLALLGAWLGRRIPLIRAAGLLYLSAMLLMTPAGSLFWTIYPFSLLQFPWRLATFAPLLQTICLIGLWQTFGRFAVSFRWAHAAGPLAILVLLAWSPLLRSEFKPLDMMHGTPLTTEELLCLQSLTGAALPGSYLSTLDATEWLPDNGTARRAPAVARGAPLKAECRATRERANQIALSLFGTEMLASHVPTPLVEVAPANWTAIPRPGHSPYRIGYQLEGTEPGEAVINQLYLPGWKVLLDGQALDHRHIRARLTPDGRMRIPLPPGKHAIEAWYEGPLYWKERDILIGLTLSLMLLYWLGQGLAARAHAGSPRAFTLPR